MATVTLNLTSHRGWRAPRTRCDRADGMAGTIPRDMCSRSSSVNARLERQHLRDRIPPFTARMPRTDV